MAIPNKLLVEILTDLRFQREMYLYDMDKYEESFIEAIRRGSAHLEHADLSPEQFDRLLEAQNLAEKTYAITGGPKAKQELAWKKEQTAQAVVYGYAYFAIAATMVLFLAVAGVMLWEWLV